MTIIVADAGVPLTAPSIGVTVNEYFASGLRPVMRAWSVPMTFIVTGEAVGLVASMT